MLRTLIAGKKKIDEKFRRPSLNAHQREAHAKEFNDPTPSGAIRQLKIHQPPTPLVKLMEQVDACAICWRFSSLFGKFQCKLHVPISYENKFESKFLSF